MVSMRFICALTAGWVRPRRLAALVRLPVSEMAINVRTISIGTLS
jgi:hypothetical protein